MSMTGGCACRAVRYRITGEPLSVHACHCTDCQTLSGSAFGLSMVLQAQQIEVQQGDISSDQFSTETTLMLRQRCAECGTAIWFSSPDYADIIALKPGTLDDTSTLQPIAHMWVRSAQPWLRLGDDVPVFDTQPTFEELRALNHRSKQQ